MRKNLKKKKKKTLEKKNREAKILRKVLFKKCNSY